MKYYGYIRVSTETQVIGGFGLDTQKEKILEYATKNSIEIEDIFTDAGISGTTIDRPALTEMLATVEADDRIIVLNTSRLWRSDTAKVLIRRDLQKSKVDIISVEQPNYSIETTDPMDFLTNSIMEILDVYDRMVIAKKLSAGRRTKARKGEKGCGSAPYGYAWQSRKIVIDYNNHMVVQEIFKRFSETGSYADVVRYCDNLGYKTKSGKSFTRQQISNMVHNDFYIGIVTHAGEKSQGTHEPIISKDLWEAVQNRLESRL